MPISFIFLDLPWSKTLVFAVAFGRFFIPFWKIIKTSLHHDLIQIISKNDGPRDDPLGNESFCHRAPTHSARHPASQAPAQLRSDRPWYHLGSTGGPRAHALMRSRIALLPIVMGRCITSHCITSHIHIYIYIYIYNILHVMLSVLHCMLYILFSKFYMHPILL